MLVVDQFQIRITYFLLWHLDIYQKLEVFICIIFFLLKVGLPNTYIIIF